MTIQTMRKEQLPQIKALLKEIFWREDSDPRCNEWELAERFFSDPGYRPELCLTAGLEGEAVGYNALTEAFIGGEKGLGLGPLGVKPSYQRQGIGSALVKESIRRARAEGYPWIVLLGGDYYARFSFRKAAPWGIYLEKDAPENEALWILPLHLEDRLPRGKLTYCGAFYDENGKLL